jgi:hypothetical protein
VSKLGEGTRVAIRLPLDCEAARKRNEIAAVHQQEQLPDNSSDNRVRISA